MIRQYRLPVLIAIAVVAIDLVTKRWASNTFEFADQVLIPGFLRLTFVENPGAAFSLFRDAGPFLGWAAIVVTAIVLYSLRHPRPLLEVIAFGLIVGGALGNLADRLFRSERLLEGKVIDWIDLWWIPTFNVADMSITFAVGLLLITAWRTRET